MKSLIFSKDSDYFKDNEDIIKLEYCKDKGESCNSQMKMMNSNLLLARKLIEQKEYSRALQEIKLAFTSTYQIKPEHCQKCAELFRDTILNSLKKIISDLKKLTSGFFAKKNYKFDLQEAENLLRELEKLNPDLVDFQ
jgi:hypothetical protein